MSLYEEYNKDYAHQMNSLNKETQKMREESKKIEIFFKKLNIPFYDSKINTIELYWILNNREKAKEIFTKLNNKAFW